MNRSASRGFKSGGDLRRGQVSKEATQEINGPENDRGLSAPTPVLPFSVVRGHKRCSTSSSAACPVPFAGRVAAPAISSNMKARHTTAIHFAKHRKSVKSSHVQCRCKGIGRRGGGLRLSTPCLHGGTPGTSNTSNTLGGVYENRQVSFYSFYSLTSDTPPITLDVLDVADGSIEKRSFTAPSAVSYVQWCRDYIGRHWTCTTAGWCNV